jgi:fimbrial chaperone protein
MTGNRGTATRLLVLACLFSLFLSCLSLYAASFDIQPVRIELNDKTRLGKLTIRNVSENDLSVQVKAYEWNQNEKAEDVYQETQDIIVFPKIMTIAKGEERFIRLGTNVQSGLKEKTYRVYIEEIPSNASDKEGTNIRLFMKVGIPLFLKSSAPQDKAEIDTVSMNEGKIRIKVRNSGNTHFIVTGINVSGQNNSGQESFNRDISGWYLLSGSEKVYETDIPQDCCAAISNFNIELKASKIVVKKQLRVDKSMCESSVASASR